MGTHMDTHMYIHMDIHMGIHMGIHMDTLMDIHMLSVRRKRWERFFNVLLASVFLTFPNQKNAPARTFF